MVQDSRYHPVSGTPSHGDTVFFTPLAPTYSRFANDAEAEIYELYSSPGTSPTSSNLPKEAAYGEKRKLRPLSSSDSFYEKNESELFDPYQIPVLASTSTRRTQRNGFERPNWTALAVHLTACAIAWPVIYIFVLIGKDKSLFMVRLVVGIGCGLVGCVLGLSLLGLAQRYIEACAWATIVHQSHSGDLSGMRLRDLESHSGHPTSALVALRVLWNRWTDTGTSRRSRDSYDNRPWSLFSLFFLFILAITASGPFVLGRIVIIKTNTMHQNIVYREIRIKRDLSGEDIQRAKALNVDFNESNWAITWTLSPFALRAGLPAAVALDYEGDQVYFSETIPNQLWEQGGSGFGTFDPNMSVKEVSTPETSSSNEILPGMVIRYPRWGIRIHCEKLPDPETNIITKSLRSLTYMFIPQRTLSSLFANFSLELPNIYKQPLNISATMVDNSALPEGLNVDTTSMGAVFYDNGVAHSFKSVPYSMGEDGKGWVSIESVLVRMNTTYAPNGKFGKRHSESVPDIEGKPTYIGYDGAVCLELFEPWVTQTKIPYVGSPSTGAVIARGFDLRNAGGFLTGGERSLMNEVNWNLTSVGKADAYIIAHQNSVNQILKDNGRDAYYVPSPTIVSYTDGYGAYGYTELSPAKFAQSRAMSDASNLLPYLAGSADLIARSFEDCVSSTAQIEPVWMVTFIIVYAVLGLFAALFVPRLPLGLQRRGFDVYSWIAAFKADELVLEGDVKLKQGMSLEEIGRRVGDLRVRHVA